MNRRSFVGGIAAVGTVLVMPSIAKAQLKAGDSKIIEYINSTGECWTASLTGLSPSGLGFSDPDFIHTGPGGEHHDKWIEYKAWDGSVWHSKCHSHTPVLGVATTFTFEHFRDINGKPDHEDDTLGFLSWDNAKWLANVPATGNIQTPANFFLKLQS
jgi:hypothetical protein